MKRENFFWVPAGLKVSVLFLFGNYELFNSDKISKVRYLKDEKMR